MLHKGGKNAMTNKRLCLVSWSADTITGHRDEEAGVLTSSCRAHAILAFLQETGPPNSSEHEYGRWSGFFMDFSASEIYTGLALLERERTLTPDAYSGI
jgi:hypothetical protein